MTLSSTLQNSLNKLNTLAGDSFVSYGWIGSYNTRGDLALTGDSLYISGISGTCIIQPRRLEEQELLLDAQGRRIEGHLVAYFKSGISLVIGNRLRSEQEDYEITHLTTYRLSGTDIYIRAVLNKIDET